MNNIPRKYSCVCTQRAGSVFSIITLIKFKNGFIIEWSNQKIGNEDSVSITSMNIDNIEQINTLFSIGTGKQYALSISGEKLIKAAESYTVHDIPSLLKIGLSAEGIVVIWYGDRLKQSIILTLQSHELRYRIPLSKDICPNLNTQINTENNTLWNLKCYTYRYVLNVTNYHDKAYKIILFEDYCNDDSFNRLNNGNLFTYHKSGRPKMMHLNWSFQNTEFEASIFLGYLFFNIFDRFYGAHRETKTDFIIRIDAEAKKYELALYRQGLKEPVVIPESAYQLIVFKNKFEDYRSENYNQPRGAWIW